jgi:hypothetical protein
MITIDMSKLYDETAKLSQLSDYVLQAKAQAGEGNVVKLTGAAPVWMYLKIAHALHGKATKLYYDSPASGEVLVFDHDPHG